VELGVAGSNPVGHPFDRLRVYDPKIMEWYLYILLCDEKTFYVGLTSNIQQRIHSHKSGYNIGTKRFSHVRLVYKEKHPSRIEAEKREKQLKGWTHAKKKALIEGNIELLKQLSKSRVR
jgi:putative endonuclease